MGAALNIQKKLNEALLLPVFSLHTGLFICILLLIGGNRISAQADREFWFAAPEINQIAGESPLILMLASMDDPVQISLSLPANPNFIPLQFSLAGQEIQIVDLSAYRSELENGPPDLIRDRGIRITASADIVAYYRVAALSNTDIFNLRGRQALGKAFFIPGQTEFINGFGRTAFHIVATQDQTTIEIIPSQQIVGHPAGQRFSVVLNRGETFTCQEAGVNANQHLAGSQVLADKPISVTFADESVSNGSGTADLMGDQLIPLQHMGTEYIIMRGEGQIERAYILATEDNTQVSIPGMSPVSLNQGETLEATVDLAAMYFQSTKPVSVWHMTGSGREAAGTVLPPLACTGARKVKYIRPTSENFYTYLLTETGNEDGFMLNGAPNIFPSDFGPVPGTNGQWVFNRIKVLPTFVTSTNEITNSKGAFHMGFLTEFEESAAYGFLSDYSTLALGESKVLCLGDSLELDAGSGKTDYRWSTGEMGRRITVDQPGTYWVSADFEGCAVSDTIEVLPGGSLSLDLGPDTLICEEEALILSLDPTAAFYQWEDGSTTTSRIIESAGTYSVQATLDGCTATDTLVVSTKILPPLSLGPDTLLCAGETLLLDVMAAGANYRWQDGGLFPQQTASEPGLYWVERSLEGCVQTDSLIVGRRELTVELGQDTLLCLGDTLRITFPQSGNQYLWEDGSTAPQRVLTRGTNLSLRIANRCESIQLQQIVQFEDCSCTPFIPNVFSPNGDGINDIFRVEMDCPLTAYSLQIFDRWGKQVFEGLQPGDTWRGIRGNQQAEPGVYFWVIRYEGTNDMGRGQIIIKGNVLLVR